MSKLNDRNWTWITGREGDGVTQLCGGGGREGSGEAKRNKSVGTLGYCLATNKVYFMVRVYNFHDNLYDRGKKM